MSDARILDRGFRRLTTQRLGTSASLRALTLYTARRVLGLRRRFRYKLIPLVVAAGAYFPAIVFVGVAALAPEQFAQALIPGPADFLGSITGSIVLFTAFSAPETLCPDRRDRTLGLYLASPLTRTSYLAAKALAVFGVLLLVTLGPPLLVQVGQALLGVGPDGFSDVMLAIVRAVAGGVVLSVGFTAVGLAGSSLTDRRAFAAAGIFLTLILLGVVGEVLTDQLGAPAWAGLVDVTAVFPEVVARLYGDEFDLAGVGLLPLLGGAFGWVLGLGGLVLWRYRRLAVTR